MSNYLLYKHFDVIAYYDIESCKFESWKYIRGLGVTGKTTDQKQILAGNIQFMQENNVTVAQHISTLYYTPLL